MTDDELREKIAETVREAASCPQLCDWLAPDRCACGQSADAIMALIRPAIQAARVEALREAERVARSISGVFKLSQLDADWARASHEAVMAHQQKADGAEGVCCAIAALVKETAP